jgi:hypothetical protein
MAGRPGETQNLKPGLQWLHWCFTVAYQAVKESARAVESDRMEDSGLADSDAG